jgi:hypothetical protein
VRDFKTLVDSTAAWPFTATRHRVPIGGNAIRGSIMLRIIISVMLIIILTIGAAFAQMPEPGVPGYSYSRTDVEKKSDIEIDHAYQSTVKRTSGAEKKKSDPWGDIRPAPPPAAKNKQ